MRFKLVLPLIITSGLRSTLIAFALGAASVAAFAPLGFFPLLLVATAWLAREWSRTSPRGAFIAGYAFGFGLFSAGASWIYVSLHDIGGVFALSFLTVALGALACLAITPGRRIAWASAFVAVLGAGEALRHVEWTAPSGAPLSVALLQGNIEQSLKFDPRRYLRTLETYAALARDSKARLIVFPETAVPRFLDTVDPRFIEFLDGVAKRNGGDMLLGVPTRTSAEEFYNSVITLGVSPRQIYRKVHLVPFGEFVPPGLGWTL